MMIPLSYLNAYAYCRRRFYYEFVLGEMVVNEHVLEGQQLHERVDRPGYGTRGEKTQLRHLYLCAPKTGLLGYCDLVEVVGESGESLAELARDHKVSPVEYKKGKMGKWLSDHTQICAQALALEEVLEIPEESITHGCVFYAGSERREEIAIDADLRRQTLELLSGARQTAQMQSPPEPISNWRKCRDCSLEPICLPREVMHMGLMEGEEEHGSSVSD